MHLNALDIMYNLSIWGKDENANNFLHIRHVYYWNLSSIISLLYF